MSTPELAIFGGTNSFLIKMWLLTLFTLVLNCNYSVNVNCGVVADMDSRPAVHDSIEEGHGSGSGDERKVTFVTAADVFEKLHSFQSSQQKETEVRPQQTTEDERCPPVPEIAATHVLLSKLCDAVKCQNDEDCSSDNVCCYNGCIDSCVHRVDAPVAFDWMEETDMTFLRNAHRGNETAVLYENAETHHSEHDSSSEENESEGGISQRALKEAKAQAETISLPGGCLINIQQYEHLKQFRKDQHVNSCTCTRGDIVCEVNQSQ